MLLRVTAIILIGAVGSVVATEIVESAFAIYSTGVIVGASISQLMD